MTPRVLSLIALIAAVPLGGCGVNRAGGAPKPPPRVLTLADEYATAGEIAGFTSAVERLSNGTLRVEVKSDWRHGQSRVEQNLIADVRARATDLGVAPTRAWDSIGPPSLRALEAPLLIDSYALEQRVVADPLVMDMLDGLRPLGLAGLGVLPGPMRKPLGITQALATPSDYRGLEIGIQSSSVAAATFRALGATPRPFPVSGAIAGLDGIEQQVDSITGNRYSDTGRYLSANVNLWPRPLVLFANQAAFADLTAKQRDILRRAVAESATTRSTELPQSEREAAETLCRAGEQFVAANVPELRRAVRPVYDELRRDPSTRAAIARIEALRRPTDRAERLSCASANTTANRASPLDGVWLSTTTPQDHAPGEPDASPSNYGRWTYVFEDGRFAVTQENADACTWGYGTFSIAGDHVSWTFKDGGGLSPDNATNKPGEFFVFGWSLYHDTLTLTPVKGQISPENFLAKPWHRTGATPSPHVLSARCPPPANALPG